MTYRFSHFAKLTGLVISPFLTENGLFLLLRRLRRGYTYLAHAYLFQGEDGPDCSHFDTLLSVEHIMVYCHWAIAEILRDSSDIPSLIKFLKENDLFFQVLDLLFCADREKAATFSRWITCQEKD